MKEKILSLWIVLGGSFSPLYSAQASDIVFQDEWMDESNESLQELEHVFVRGLENGNSTDWKKIFLKEFQDKDNRCFSIRSRISDGKDVIIGIVFYSYDARFNSSWLSYIVVAPENRRKGVGRAAVDHIQKACGCEIMELCAFKGAFPFYKKLGFAHLYDGIFKKKFWSEESE